MKELNLVTRGILNSLNYYDRNLRSLKVNVRYIQTGNQNMFALDLHYILKLKTRQFLMKKFSFPKI